MIKRLVLLIFILGSNLTFAQETDAQLIDNLQMDALKYFWDYTHPVSKLSREGIHQEDLTYDQNTIAPGGSGFGFLNIIPAFLLNTDCVFIIE